MRVAVMQPYFLPYIGYFQLLHAVDTLVLYDNLKYTKKGWINRNRFLLNGSDAMFSLPLRAGSDALNIVERELAPDFQRTKLLNQLGAAYRKAPFYADSFKLLEEIIHCDDNNLFGYIAHSLRRLCHHLALNTRIVVSSTIDINHSLKAQDKVIALCNALGGRTYINLPGGTTLYDGRDFQRNGLDLCFIQPRKIEYSQFGNPFIPWLSILDVMMFNSIDDIRGHHLPAYQIQPASDLPLPAQD